MNELLISLYCPPTSKTYDFWVPRTMTVAEAMAQISDAISEFENKPNVFKERGSLILSSYMTKETLPPGVSMEEAGIRSGDKLALL